MKASELVEQLQAAIAEHGPDIEMALDNSDWGSAPQVASSTSVMWFQRQDYTPPTWSYGSLHKDQADGRRKVFVLHPRENTSADWDADD